MKGLLLQTAQDLKLIDLYNKILLQGQYQVDRMITQLIKGKVVMVVMLSYQIKVVKFKIIIQNFILILKQVVVIIQGLLLLQEVIFKIIKVKTFITSNKIQLVVRLNQILLIINNFSVVTAVRFQMINYKKLYKN